MNEIPDNDEYKQAIEKVNWLVGEMSAEDLDKFPLTAERLNSIRQRLNFIFGIKQ